MNGNLFTAITDTDLQLPIYLTNCGGWINQETMDRPYGFPDYHWIQTTHGEGLLESDGQTISLTPGQGMLIFPDKSHRYSAVQEPWGVMWVTFNGKHVEGILNSLEFFGTQVLYISNPNRTLAKMNKIISLMSGSDPLRSVEASAIVYEILLDLFICGSTSEVRSKQQHYEQLEPVFTYIEKHYGSDIELVQLAKQLGVSPQHTCLLFKQTLGMRPFEYITLYRIRKAKELLVEHMELDIQEIAKAVGYPHASYFIKLFKKAEGVTPNMFRRLHRVGI
jgi:AraC family transcriptional regulator of arabinose operon